MRRRIMRADGNHAEIVKALTAIGATVVDLHRVGGGVPDLLVGYRRVMVLVELKRPGKPLEPHQAEWAAAWRGSPVLVAHSAFEAIAGIMAAASGRAAA
jgi:hypothetical protein